MKQFIQVAGASAALLGALCLSAGAAQAQGKSKSAHAEHGQPAKSAAHPHAPPGQDKAEPSSPPMPAAEAKAHAAGLAKHSAAHAAHPAHEPHERDEGSELADERSAPPSDGHPMPGHRLASMKAAWAEALQHARIAAKRQSAGHGDKQARAKKASADEPVAAEQEPAEDGVSERAQKHRKALHQRFAAVGKDQREPLAQELRHHAHRTAKLARIRAIAENKNDAQTIGRVDRLLERELARHDAKIARISATAAKGPADSDQENTAPGGPDQHAQTATAKENVP